ncbi:MAG TPA: RNA polymerase sigma factor [Thermoanaerobaculia bacterium]|nr:RNA polymerase sigma factor [Thermoanaerobaculia bacterium]
MSELSITSLMKVEQDQRVSEALDREESRLRNWIARHLADPSEVEDVLQDVFFELVLAYRLTKPIEHVSAWLFRVARNRINDLLRKKRPEPIADQTRVTAQGGVLALEDLLPSPEAGPEAEYACAVLLEELDEALEELPPEQREVFLAHEVEGLSFKEISARTGVGVNTLLSRKHYAVLQLRRRLQAIYDEFQAL